ncbi:class I SAM-dependent methyltransferase [Oceanobacillus salinisoli]|uniref:class I SAM-dependent methyltransferase n=1 Tax=Oceanobacillus salinisoli TaxID=2678611 RepID=UPI0012E2F5FB|nr:class I SAM-dependent methyltransferase [Oceanobacillus salinisoli]
MNHSKINQDNWNAQLYDGKHGFVSKHGSRLIELLEPKKGEVILDLGCGTGDLANDLFNSGVNVVGVDKSENMIEQARMKYPEISFYAADATELTYDHEFDAVFSNAVLHWVKPPHKALACIYLSLKNGGRFVAEFGGKGNVQTIIDEIIDQIKQNGNPFKEENFPWFYPSIAEYTALMEEVGFRVTFAQHFDRPTLLEGENGLRNWVEMFAGSLLKDMMESEKESILTNVENNLREKIYEDGQWVADYKRIRVIGIK